MLLNACTFVRHIFPFLQHLRSFDWLWATPDMTLYIDILYFLIVFFNIALIDFERLQSPIYSGDFVYLYLYLCL